MKTDRARALLAIPSLLVLLSSTIVGAAPTSFPTSGALAAVAAPAAQQSFADEAFRAVWTRTDALVANGTVKRSYYWGPTPSFSTMEEYAEGLGGKRLVQYFDKSRMEINNPSADRSNPFYVTNGLLAMELVSGRMQTGNKSFTMRYPAEINLASDTDDTGAGTPTYASFRYLVGQGPVGRGFDDVGQTVLSTINRAGDVDMDRRFGNYNVKYAYGEAVTGRSIPDVFWQFLNTTGPVIENGRTVNARLNDPYFYATGYPMSDAYWASVKIAGARNTDVLIQVYERRVLTYVPTAPEGFRVQMGNIGRHYYDWRYGGLGRSTPSVPPTPSLPLSCRSTPIRGFGKVWADHTEVQYALNCPRFGETTATVLQQSFEHGQMLQVTDYYTYGPFGTGKSIYVLFEDGTLQQFQDTYVEGDPEPAIAPPQGLYVPKRGFGKLWREGTGAKVRERLGWAVAPETLAKGPARPIPGAVPTATARPGSTATPTLVPGTSGAAQEFEKGYMVYAGPALRKIYVLYNATGYNAYTVSRWLMYDDLFREP